MFITMNPGYQGRNELPDNLKHLFCPFALSFPDASYILQCSLFTIGYPDHVSIARKTASLLSVCSQIFNASDYDFGLRTVKDLLQHIRPGKSVPECIYNLMLPRMALKDRGVFKELIASIFDKETVEVIPDMEYLEFEKVQDCNPRLLRHASHLIEAIHSHIGVLLVGALETGYSLVKLCADVLKVELLEITPSTLTKVELFGELDSSTFEWRDGVFTEAYRHALLTPNPFWIVMDGNLDHSWIENLNR
jgi:hypothetical protein